MPLTADLRRDVDQIRNHLWAGGFPDPMQNAEQLSFLFFFYLFEAADEARARAAKRPGAEPYASPFDGAWTLRNPTNARKDGEKAIAAANQLWRASAN